MSVEYKYKQLQKDYEALEKKHQVCDYDDAVTLAMFTDGKESWYGTEIDKTKFKVVFADETEDTVYLKIVKKQPLTTGEENV